LTAICQHQVTIMEEKLRSSHASSADGASGDDHTPDHISLILYWKLDSLACILFTIIQSHLIHVYSLEYTDNILYHLSQILVGSEHDLAQKLNRRALVSIGRYEHLQAVHEGWIFIPYAGDVSKHHEGVLRMMRRSRDLLVTCQHLIQAMVSVVACMYQGIASFRMRTHRMCCALVIVRTMQCRHIMCKGDNSVVAIFAFLT
jgi:hypothetical protein